jgi:class 3 adenylate cyclase/predicted ATPase/energy-coupling factor transporter ATP-binding protein EcfA2
MICPRCGATVANNKKFCGDCGTPLPWRCTACGGSNPADKRFCSDCGAARGATSDPLPAAAATPSPERRLVSAMFVDLTGSAEIGRRLDPKDFRETIGAVHGLVATLVARFNGFIAPHKGDGILVYFGYPQAHETDAERAIRAGLTIVEAVARLDSSAGPPGTLSVSVGINSGVVIAGDVVGSGSSLEAAAVGDTPNLAARLQAAATAGAVVISEATRLLVGSLFEYRELISTKLKGQPAWIVLGESLIDSRYEALRQGQSPLVGRREELELLVRRWEHVKTGEGRVVLVTGEPGIGKSRLIAALENYLAAEPHGRLRFFCSPHHVDTPLHPLIQHIEREAKFQRRDSDTTKWGKLSSLLPPDATLEDKVLLADLLSIPGSDRDLLNNLSPPRRKAMTFAVIIRQMASLAQQKPTLVMLEDIQWADPTSIDLLDELVKTVRQLPILFIMTARPEVRPAWVGRPHVTVQLLSALDRRTSVALIQNVAGERELSAEIVDRIFTRADGLPLFMEELTKTVLNTLQTRDDGDNASPIETLSVDMVPTSLHSSLMARLDRLSTGKEIAQVGAVIGREFSFEAMQGLSPLPKKQLEQTLRALVKAEIIAAHGEPPFATYSFRHALVHDAAYASLLRDRRRAIHLQVAKQLEKNAIGELAEPQSIARHFAEAGVPDKSIHYYQKAAERVTGRFALAEMVNLLRNALQQIPNLPDSEERQRRELALQLALGRVVIDHEGASSEAVRATFERARELCFALDEMKLLPRVYDGLILNYHFIHSEQEKIVQYTSEMVAVHRRTGDPQALLMTKRAGGLANLLQGNFALAHQEMQQIIDMYDAERDRPEVGMSIRDPKVSAGTLLGICLTILGYVDAGAAMSKTGVEHARTLDHPVSLNLGLRRACVQGMLVRDTERVTTLSNQLAALRAAYETYKGNWEGTFFHDWAQLQKRPEPALFERMQAFLHQLDTIGNWALLPFYMACVAELRGQSGDVTTAMALVDRAAELANTTGSRWCDAEITRLRACYSARDPEDTAGLLRASLSIAKEQRAKLWEVRAATSLAKLLRDQGDHAAARAVLEPTCEWFREGRETGDLIAARTLLNALR